MFDTYIHKYPKKKGHDFIPISTLPHHSMGKRRRRRGETRRRGDAKGGKEEDKSFHLLIVN
jgi:hypothetical protein